MTATADTIVIGGGMVGSAIAWGLCRRGIKVLVLDGADDAERAARANFGLVWGQSKGDGLAEYAHWTREAIALWPAFQDELLNLTGVSCGFSGNGGLHLCMSEAELESRRALFARMERIGGENPLYLRVLDQGEVADLVPGIGADVVGAGFCGQDGHASPHGLLLAMHRAIQAQGGEILSNHAVTSIGRENGVWKIESGQSRFEAAAVVLAAGTANKALGTMLALDIPVFGLKGQILVSERMASVLEIPTHKVRQTEAGTMLLGDSKEPEAGHDDRSTSEMISDIAQRSIRMFPWLAEVNLVRAWGGIRTMTEDGFPLYDSYTQYPGLFSANCHSGVTLAPVHALRLAPMIAEASFPPQLAAMSSRRLHVQA
ncbi:glycine/D-amino acid oxidase-like deaminating enzyme [Roseovarius halotolerans]|nr:FAD-dependent oxidoreductase [Roseovarius halotolerans]RKT30991.1 glycine/D-amino acid oxidase-like deaminating enzyme [Roseovarius halotolerans]